MLQIECIKELNEKIVEFKVIYGKKKETRLMSYKNF